MLLYGGVLTRLGKVDAPVSSHGNEAPVSWPCRSGWTFPSIWLAAGDFNANLAERLSWISTAFVLRSEGPWFLGHGFDGGTGAGFTHEKQRTGIQEPSSTINGCGSLLSLNPFERLRPNIPTPKP